MKKIRVILKEMISQRKYLTYLFCKCVYAIYWYVYAISVLKHSTDIKLLLKLTGTATLDEAYLQPEAELVRISWSSPLLMTKINVFYCPLRRLSIHAIRPHVLGSSNLLLQGSNWQLNGVTSYIVPCLVTGLLICLAFADRSLLEEMALPTCKLRNRLTITL